jgi:hypothetical protein
MKRRPPDTGPPSAKNVDAVVRCHGALKVDVNPASARDNLQFGFLRQVCTRPVGLAHVEKALQPEDWRWLRRLLNRGRSA